MPTSYHFQYLGSIICKNGQIEELCNILYMLFFFWGENWFGKHQSTIWNMIPGCLLWLAWQEHDNRIFEDNERSLDLLKHLLFGTLFQWARIWGLTQCISISAFYNLLAVSCQLLSFLYFLHVQSVHHHEHDDIFSIRVLLPIKNNNNNK